MRNKYLISSLSFSLIIFSCFLIKAQTNPTAQGLPNSQTFTIAATSTLFPAGWQGWKIGAAASSSFITTAATSDKTLIASSTAATTASGIHNFNGKIGFLSDTANVALVVAINTIGNTNITARFDIMTMRNVQDGSSNTRVNMVDLQYRVGTSGNFTSVLGLAAGIYQNNTTNQVTGTTGQNIVAKSLVLPAACNNQSVVQLRWVLRDTIGVGSRPSFAIDNVCISSITPSITITGSSIFCGGTARFVANTSNGGTIPAYQWKKNNTNVGTNSNTLDIGSLVVGDTIRCTLTSNLACVTSTSVLSNDIRINSVATSPTISSAVVTPSSCNNGAIDLTVTGGTLPYVNKWDTTNTVSGPTFLVSVGSKVAGHPYFGQGNPATFIIDLVPAKRLTLTRGIEYVFTVGGGHPFNIATDSVGLNSTFIANGQTGAPTGGGTVRFRPNSTHANPTYYTCQAHDLMGYKIDLQSYVSEDLTNRNPGTYAVIVTDANGCTVQNQYVINSAPFTLAVTATTTPASCNGSNGAINATVTGGTAPYTICWDTINRTNGAQFAVTAGTKTAANPYFGLGSSVGFFIDGTEAKAITLAKNIKYTFNIFNVGHPWHISTDSVGGSISGIVTNGQNGAPKDNGVVTFLPDNSHPAILRYVCSVHQYMGYRINIANSYCVEDPAGLPAGTYTVNVKDAVGCSVSANFTVSSLAPINVVLTSTSNTSCFGKADGGVNFTPTGGSPPYSVTGTGPTYTVITEVKNHSHQQFGAGSTNGFTINGIQGKELTLIRGVTYNFSVLTPGHPFFISTSFVGGPSNIASEVTNGVTNSMTVNGTLTFTPNATHPALLFYQCALHDNMGWKINIVDQLGAGDLDSCMAGGYHLAVKDASGCSSAFFDFTLNEPPGTSFYYDGDGDSYGRNNEFTSACTPPAGFTVNNNDCNDANLSIHPGATELCNSIDDDCDNLVDEGFTLQTLYFDNDSDGYGTPPSQTFCTAPEHWVTTGTDCNNNNPAIHPGAVEICSNSADDNCNGQVDENCDTSLTIKLFIEGYYLGNQTMDSVLRSADTHSSGLLCDSIIVELHDTMPPYMVLKTDTVVVTIYGIARIPISQSLFSTTVYIAIRSRNTVEIWSKIPLQLGVSTFYDFSVSSASRSSLTIYGKNHEH